MRYVIYNLEVTSWLIDQAGGSEEAVKSGNLHTGMAWLVVGCSVSAFCDASSFHGSGTLCVTRLARPALRPLPTRI